MVVFAVCCPGSGQDSGDRGGGQEQQEGDQEDHLQGRGGDRGRED